MVKHRIMKSKSGVLVTVFLLTVFSVSIVGCSSVPQDDFSESAMKARGETLAHHEPPPGYVNPKLGAKAKAGMPGLTDVKKSGE